MREFAKIHAWIKRNGYRPIKAYRVTSYPDKNEAASEVSVLSDGQSRLHAAFHADQPCLYLIRPDGYVGYRSRPPKASAFREYLRRVLNW